jgi:hypothetical protein
MAVLLPGNKLPTFRLGHASPVRDLPREPCEQDDCHAASPSAEFLKTLNRKRKAPSRDELFHLQLAIEELTP